MAKARMKTPAMGHNLVPQGREAAVAQIVRIGELGREIARRKADLNDALARIKEQAETASEPLRVEIRELTDGLQTWCEAHRNELTDGGRVKSADLGTGLVKWRLRPPKVTLRDVEGVIARLRLLGLQRFIRTKEEVNKEAMQDEPQVAREVDGVSVGSAGEEFIVEPFEVELQGAAA